MQIKKRPLFVLLLFYSLINPCLDRKWLFAQVLPSVLPDEPPSSLFSTKLDDDELEILVQGFWEASILSSATISSSASGIKFNSTPFLFKQNPDLYAFLRFKEKWIFEAYINNDTSNNRFALSFEGDDNDTIKLARLGNSGIVMPTYPFLAFGAPKSSFGFVLNAVFEEPSLKLDMLLRWDGLSWKTRRFSGSVEASETIVSPKDQLRARRFLLPDAPVSSLELKETVSGRSRLLASDEYTISLYTGLILLEKPVQGRLEAIYKDKNSVQRNVFLYEVKKTEEKITEIVSSPYEVLNSYALADSTENRRLFVRNNATGQTDLYYEVSSFAPGIIQVVKLNSEAPSASDGFRRPFFDEAPWYYEAENPGSIVGEAYEIVALNISPSEGKIKLEASTVPGSISVSREGIPSNSFVYDKVSQNLVLIPEPSPGEYIEIHYATESPDTSNGSLAYGIGARFPFLGLDWSLALGGSQALFGPSFDEAGSKRPSWFALSMGSGYKNNKDSFDAAVSLRFGRAGSSKYYRVLGMEEVDSRKYLASFRSKTTVQDLLVESVPDSALIEEQGFAQLLKTLHYTGEENRILKISTTNAINDKIDLLRYIDPLPLASYKKLSFFIRTENLSSSIKLSFGDGSASGGAIIEIPATVAVDMSKWNRIELDLNSIATVKVFNGKGEQIPNGGISASFAQIPYAGLAEVIIDGMQFNSIVEIDEICLLEPVDGISLQGESAFLLDRQKAAKGYFVKADIAGILEDAPSANAVLEAAWANKFFDLSSKINPSYGGEAERFFLGLGYTIAIPSKQSSTRIMDQFFWKTIDNKKSKALEAAIALGSYSTVLNAKFEQNMFSSSQNWTAIFNFSDFLKTSALASLELNDKADSVLGYGSDSDFFQAWLDSWPGLLPQNEKNAETRKIEFKLNALNSLLQSSIKHSFEKKTIPSSYVEAKLEWPFKFGPWTFVPFYKRKSSIESASAAQTFFEDLCAMEESLEKTIDLWTRLPFKEFLDKDMAFYTFSDEADKAEHSVDTGFSISRPLGNAYWDLIIPSNIKIQYGRTESKNADVFLDSYRFILNYAGGSANLFGLSGTNPLFNWLLFDEYTYKNSVELKIFDQDMAILPKLSSNLALSLDGKNNWILGLVNDFSYEETRSNASWIESLASALTIKPDKTWLGVLFDLSSRNARKTADKPKKENKYDKSDTWVSAWLEDTLNAKPVYTDKFELKTGVGQKSVSTGNTALRFSFDYSSRVSLAGSLHFSIGGGIWQTITLQESNNPMTSGVSVFMEGKLVF